MAAPAVTIDDFLNLLKPGQLADVGFTIQSGMSNLTTTAMFNVLPADVRALGPLVTAVRTAAISTALAPPAGATGAPGVADIKRVTDEYATIPTLITAYVTPAAPRPPSGSSQTISASIDPTYNALIRFIRKSIDDFGSILMVNTIQLNGTKSDAATIAALTTLVISYTSYLSGIVKAFKFNTADLDPNYDLIIGNIEKTINKMGVTVGSPRNILLSDLNTLVIPLPPVVAQTFTPPTPPPAVPLNGLSPDGSIKLNSDSGYNAAGHYATQYPSPTQIICLNVNPLNGIPNIPIWPQPGWAVSGKYVQPGTTLISANRTQAPSNPYVNGILIGLSTPMVGLRGQGDQGFVSTYTFTPPVGHPLRTAAFAAFAPAQEAYESAVRVTSGSHAAAMRQFNMVQSGALAALPRPTPDAPIVEIAKSINASLSAMIREKRLGAVRNLRTITAIRELPSIFSGLVHYIMTNRAFLVSIGNQGAFTIEYMAPIFPIPPATQRLYDTLNMNNFETNLTQANTGILTVLISRYTVDFSSNYIQKIISKANSTLGSETQKIAGASIISKFLSFYISFLNRIINIFKINLGADISINPHITLMNRVLSKMGTAILIAPTASGGGRKRLSRRHKKLRRRYKTKRGRSKLA